MLREALESALSMKCRLTLQVITLPTLLPWLCVHAIPASHLPEVAEYVRVRSLAPLPPPAVHPPISAGVFQVYFVCRPDYTFNPLALLESVDARNRVNVLSSLIRRCCCRSLADVAVSLPYLVHMHGVHKLLYILLLPVLGLRLLRPVCWTL